MMLSFTKILHHSLNIGIDQIIIKHPIRRPPPLQQLHFQISTSILLSKLKCGNYKLIMEVIVIMHIETKSETW